MKGVLETPEFKYEGEFKHGMMDGKGFYHWKNKGRYEGEFAQNLKHGKGKLYNTEGEFVKLAKF